MADWILARHAKYTPVSALKVLSVEEMKGLRTKDAGILYAMGLTVVKRLQVMMFSGVFPVMFAAQVMRIQSWLRSDADAWGGKELRVETGAEIWRGEGRCRGP